MGQVAVTNARCASVEHIVRAVKQSSFNTLCHRLVGLSCVASQLQVAPKRTTAVLSLSVYKQKIYEEHAQQIAGPPLK